MNEILPYKKYSTLFKWNKRMRYLMAILLFTIHNIGFSQKSMLIPDTTIAIPQ